MRHHFYIACRGMAVGMFFFTAARAEEPPVIFPQGWAAEEETTSGIISWWADVLVKGGSEAMVQIVKIPVVVPDLEAQLAGFNLGHAKNKNAGRKPDCTSVSAEIIDSRRALTNECYYEASNIRMWFTVANGDATSYLLTYIGKPPNYEKHLLAWRKMLENAKIK